MAATGFTPISLYYSATGAAVPAAVDLVAGELALNTNDGKLYFKNSSSVVTLLASATTVTNSFSAGTTGLTPNTATTGAVTLAGTLAVANGGTGLSSGTSGGVLAYTATGTLASSAALAASALVIGGGAGAAPSTTTTGTGVVTALGVNTGTAGAFVVNGGALGTPASGTVTNLTGTASININGTVGATTATTGAFTTVSATGAISSTTAGAITTPAVSARYNTANSRMGFNIANSNGFPYIGFNANPKLASDNATYDLTQGATQLRMDSGQFSFNYAASGTAGADISFSTAAVLSSTGLAVTGTLSATGNITAGNTAGNFEVVVGNASANYSSGVILKGSSTNTNWEIGQNRLVSSALTFAPSTVGGGSTFTTSAMTLDSSGNLGIGTTLPQAKLQVLDRIKVSDSTQGQGSIVLGDGASTTFNVGIARWNGSTNAPGASGMGYFSQGTINSGGHYFYTGDAAAGSQTERARIPPAGGFQSANSISVGNVTPSASGAGITFPATQSASSDPNTLDDYEEGIVTPIIATPDTGTITLNASSSIKYTKIGRVVTYNGFIEVSSVSSPTGNVYFTGAFTSVGPNTTGAIAVTGNFNSFVGYIPVIRIQDTQSTIYLQKTDETTGTLSAAATLLKAGSTFEFQISILV